MNDELLRQQINDLIRDEIQENINEYVDEKNRVKTPEGFGGFVSPEDKEKELKVNIPESEVDRILKEYKKIKRKQKSNFSQIKKLGLLDKNGNPL
tara:strand:- start:206 stop:490 length:285 start_codon:yes stop_codon:yes gene_type:complete